MSRPEIFTDAWARARGEELRGSESYRSASYQELPRALGRLKADPSPEGMPFGLRLEDFTDFAMTRFQRRLARIEKARHQGLEEILHGAGEERPAP